MQHDYDHEIYIEQLEFSKIEIYEERYIKLRAHTDALTQAKNMNNVTNNENLGFEKDDDKNIPNPPDYGDDVLYKKITSDSRTIALMAILKSNIQERSEIIKLLNENLVTKHQRPTKTMAEWFKILPQFSWSWESATGLFDFCKSSLQEISKKIGINLVSMIRRVNRLSIDTERMHARLLIEATEAENIK